MADGVDEIPSTVDACVRRMQAGRDHLEALIATLSDEQLTVPGPESWSIKDHLTHLDVWSRAMLDTLSGRSRYPRLGVADYAELEELGFDVVNARIYDANRDLPLADVLAGFRDSHQEMIDRIAQMTDADLVRPYASYYPENRHGWDDAIVNWISGNTWEHDAGHLFWIRRQFNL